MSQARLCRALTAVTENVPDDSRITPTDGVSIKIKGGSRDPPFCVFGLFSAVSVV